MFTIIQKIRNKIRVAKSNNLEIDRSSKIVNCKIIIKGQNNSLIIQKNSRIRNAIIEIIGDNCLIEIGENSMIGDNCYLSSKENNIQLKIGKDCGLSRNVKVMTSDGHPIFVDNKRINEAKDIIIHNKVWIGDNVTILKGVEIGSGSVVGINATVVKSVPVNSIAVGNPAKIVKENIKWEDKFE